MPDNLLLFRLVELWLALLEHLLNLTKLSHCIIRITTEHFPID
jgi:hypothetical protein